MEDSELIQKANLARKRGDRLQALEYFRVAVERDPANPSIANELALELRALERFDEAEQILRTLTETRSDFAPAWNTLGHLARRRGDRAQAVQCFREAAAHNAENPWYASDLAAELRALEHFDEAEAILRRLVERRPEIPEGWNGLGHLSRQRGERLQALDFFRTAFERSPENSWVASDLAAELRALQRFEEADAILLKLVNTHPHHAPAWSGIGQLARQRGDRKKAAEYFRKAVDCDANNPWLMGDLAGELRALERFGEAEAVWRKLIALQPENAAAWNGLGHVERRRGNRQQAAEHFRAATERDANNPWLASDLAAELHALGRLDEAESTLRALLPSHAVHASVWSGLGHIERSRGHREKAEEFFRAAHERAPENPWFASDLAAELRALDRVDEAEDLLRIVVGSFPENGHAWNGLGHIARRRGEREKALDLFRAAVACDGGNPWFKFDLAAELSQLGRSDEAEDILRRLTEKHPEIMAGWSGLGHLARRRGDRAQALDFYRAAAERDPDNVWVACDIGGELCELGRFAEAEAFTSALVARRPGSAVALLAHARSIRGKASKQALISLFQSAVTLEPTNMNVRLSLASELLQTGRLDEAQSCYDFVLSVQNAHCEALIGKGFVARRRGDAAAALEWLQRARAANPSHEGATVECARELAEAGRFDEAENLIRETVEKFPGSPGNELFVGQIARMRGDFVAARLAFALVVEKYPHLLAAQIDLAAEETRAGAADAARTRLEGMIAQNPTFPRAYEALADLQQRLENLPEALAYLKKALALDSSNLWTHLEIARLAARMGDRSEAAAALSVCDAHFGAPPEIEVARAEIFRMTGDNRSARENLRLAVEKFPNHFELKIHFARALMICGDFAEAAQVADSAFARANARERGRLAAFRGDSAAAQWRQSEALEQYVEALRLNPADAWINENAARAALLLADAEAARRHLELARKTDATHLARFSGAARPAQSHVGQLLDEYQLDAEALGGLRAALAQPRASTPLAPLIRDYPDYTPAAIGLVVALRREGLLARGPAPEAESRAIPAKIAQYWDGDPPTDVLALCETWREKNPGFAYTRHSLDSARSYLHAMAPRLLRAFDRAREQAMKADIFRLAVLLREGGFYADADDRCLCPIVDFTPVDCDLILYQEDFGTIGNNFIGVIPGHPVIKAALSQAVEAVERGDNDILWLATGPGLITRCAALFLADDPSERLKRTAILDRHELVRNVGIHCAVSYKHTGKHWVKAAFGRNRSHPPRHESSI